jgi:hypothetical protein
LVVAWHLPGGHKLHIQFCRKFGNYLQPSLFQYKSLIMVPGIRRFLKFLFGGRYCAVWIVCECLCTEPVEGVTTCPPAFWETSGNSVGVVEQGWELLSKRICCKWQSADNSAPQNTRIRGNDNNRWRDFGHRPCLPRVAIFQQLIAALLTV